MSIPPLTVSTCAELEADLKNLCIEVSKGCESTSKYFLIISTTFMICSYTLGAINLLHGGTRTVQLIRKISYKCLYHIKPENRSLIEPHTGKQLWNKFLKSAKKITEGVIPIAIGIMLTFANKYIQDGFCASVTTECTSLTGKIVTFCNNIDTTILTSINNTLQSFLHG